MTTITQELERMAHDLTTGPSFRENTEIAIAGGAVGAALGYLRHRSKSEAINHAMWGASIGVVGQYLIFHMLKPALRQFSHTAQVAASMPPRVGAPFGRFGRFGGYGGMPGGFRGPWGREMWREQFQPVQFPQVQVQCPSGTVPDPASGQCVQVM